MGEITRKIQTVGERSFSISLPKEWVQSNKLSAQDILFLEELSTGELLIKQSAPKDEKHSFVVPYKSIQNLTDLFYFCYMVNVDSITITSDEFSLESLRKIKKVIQKLEGFSITQESAKAVEISFIFQDVSLTIQKIATRMIYLLQLMIEAKEKNLQEDLEETEKTIDRSYYLAKRILCKSMTNKKTFSENKLQEPHTLFFYWDMFKKLENIGDRIYNDSYKKEELQFLLKIILDMSQIWHSKKSPSYTLQNIYPDHFGVSSVFDLSIDFIENLSYIQLSKDFI
jgi:phosphate uptake regulator